MSAPPLRHAFGVPSPGAEELGGGTLDSGASCFALVRWRALALRRCSLATRMAGLEAAPFSSSSRRAVSMLRAMRRLSCRERVRWQCTVRPVGMCFKFTLLLLRFTFCPPLPPPALKVSCKSHSSSCTGSRAGCTTSGRLLARCKHLHSVLSKKKRLCTFGVLERCAAVRSSEQDTNRSADDISSQDSALKALQKLLQIKHRVGAAVSCYVEC